MSEDNEDVVICEVTSMFDDRLVTIETLKNNKLKIVDFIDRERRITLNFNEVNFFIYSLEMMKDKVDE